VTPEDELHTRFASLVEADAGTREAFVRALPDDARRALITWVGVELATMPVPLGIDAVERFLPMRNSLERIGALAELADGKPDRMLRACRAAWIHEGDHASYLELLRAHGDRTEAREVALMVLEQRWASDRALDGLVAEVIGIPEGVRVAVHALAESPSCAGFDDIVRFAPADRLDDWMRFTMRLLLRLGTEPTFVLEQLSAHGFSHALAELLESGRLAPHVIAAQAQLAPQEERARYLAYAARSAAVRGEAFATARWLREASIAQAHADELKETHRFVMLHATPEIRDVLARARLSEAPSTRC
jgi:hypothetical protein